MTVALLRHNGNWRVQSETAASAAPKEYIYMCLEAVAEDRQ